MSKAKEVLDELKFTKEDDLPLHIAAYNSGDINALKHALYEMKVEDISMVDRKGNNVFQYLVLGKKHYSVEDRLALIDILLGKIGKNSSIMVKYKGRYLTVAALDASVDVDIIVKIISKVTKRELVAIYDWCEYNKLPNKSTLVNFDTSPDYSIFSALYFDECDYDSSNQKVKRACYERYISLTGDAKIKERVDIIKSIIDIGIEPNEDKLKIKGDGYDFTFIVSSIALYATLKKFGLN